MINDDPEIPYYKDSLLRLG
jgi:hypothetical protein